MTESKRPRLFPSQVCFVVDDVAVSVDDCVSRFGWGPFEQFTAPVPDASYRGWSGRKLTDVALGMAGKVQVELIHVREGHDAIEAYQAEYGTGFQHLGIGCRSREAAIHRLEEIGAVLHEQTEYAGFRIAFVDVPTGPAMFELLQRVAKEGAEPGTSSQGKGDAQKRPDALDLFALDRATIVTGDMDGTLRFYAAAFGWDGAAARRRVLRWGPRESRVRHYLGIAGSLQLELIEPERGGDDPYASHLERGDHGLIHAGGQLQSDTFPAGASIECEWTDDGEAFALYDWSGGNRALQMRRTSNP